MNHGSTTIFIIERAIWVIPSAERANIRFQLFEAEFGHLLSTNLQTSASTRSRKYPSQLPLSNSDF